jgi:hypothetical protein
MKRSGIKFLIIVGLLLATAALTLAADRIARPPSQVTRGRIVEQSGRIAPSSSARQEAYENSSSHDGHEHALLRSSTDDASCPAGQVYCPVRLQCADAVDTTPRGSKCSECGGLIIGGVHTTNLTTDHSTPLSDGMLALIVCCLCYMCSAAVMLWRRKKSEK